MRIQKLVDSYVDFRRTLGEKCVTNNAVLRSFCRAVGPRKAIASIEAKEVAAFLAGKGPITRSWHDKFSSLKGFFQFAVTRGYLKEIPLPKELPKRPPTLLPYIYSYEELRRLFNAVPSFKHFPKPIEPPTVRAILLLAYGAGLRRQELLNLALADADLPSRLLTIRDTKFFKSRLVPIGNDLTKVLTAYACWRTATHPPSGSDDQFFVGRDGAAVNRWTLDQAFARLRRHAGIQRSDGGRYQPRLHDLRHNAASRVMPS